jgi:hypothetical protein
MTCARIVWYAKPTDRLPHRHKKTLRNIPVWQNILDKKHIIDVGNSGDAIGLPTFIGGQRNLLEIMFKAGF